MKKQYNRPKKNNKSELYTNILSCVRIIRTLSFVYAFLALLAWILQCTQSFNTFTRFMAPLFAIPKALVNFLTISNTTTSDNSLSFTLLVISALSLLFGFAMDYVINYLNQIINYLKEEEENALLLNKINKERSRQQRRRKVKEQQTANDKSQETALFEMPTIDLVQNVKSLKYADLDNINLLFLVEARISKIKKTNKDIDLTFQKLELWKKRIYKSILDAIVYSKPLQKGFYRKNLFLIYESFNYSDDFMYYIKPVLDAITIEYRKYGISVSFCYVLSALINIDFLEKELDCMDTVLSLDFENKFIVTHSFKSTYDNKIGRRYSIELKGEYNLSKNLTITNRQPLYIINDVRPRGVN